MRLLVKVVKLLVKAVLLEAMIGIFHPVIVLVKAVRVLKVARGYTG